MPSVPDPSSGGRAADAGASQPGPQRSQDIQQAPKKWASDQLFESRERGRKRARAEGALCTRTEKWKDIWERAKFSVGKRLKQEEEEEQQK